MKRKEYGSSLIELIVVLLLISIVFTGSMTSLLKSQQLTRQSILSLDILFLTSNLVNKIQLNSNHALDKYSRYLLKINALTEISSHCSAGPNCLQQMQALRDLQEFQFALNRLKANYLVSICRDATPYDGGFYGSDGCDNRAASPVSIKIWWIDNSRNAKPAFFYASTVIIQTTIN